MSKSESNSKPQFKKPGKEIPTASELKVPGFGQTRVMTDEDAARVRAKLISSGQIKENPSYDGFMSKEEVASYRQKLIDKGVLNPGAGLHKLQRAKRFRPKPRPSNIKFN